ncbi:MAG: thioredoxin fold domain-containing protein [Methylococcales bacterium]|nr:thioredoxin fold domain-containing protein [Methylococcales bacterium]
MIKKFKIRKIEGLIYLMAFLLLFVAPIFVNFNPLSGRVPQITQAPLKGTMLQKPKFIYFWAKWCATCEKMKAPISTLLNDYDGVSIAVRSGPDEQLQPYLTQHQLDWLTINDENGTIANQYFVNAVPTIFILNANGEIAFVTLGYMSEWSLRFRLWLAN